MKAIRSLPAINDVIETANYIATDNRQAAARFVDAVDESIKSLEANPRIGVELPERENLRMWFVKGFKKHVILYRTMNDEIRIDRVIHSSLDYKGILSEES